MEKYFATVLFGTFTILFIIVTMVSYLLEKKNGTYSGWSPPVAFVAYPILIILFLIVCSSEHREAKTPYDMEYTCKLYYYDGSSEVKTFTCRGYHYPRIVNRTGGFAFSCGTNMINAVTRFDVLNKKKIDKKD